MNKTYCIYTMASKKKGALSNIVINSIAYVLCGQAECDVLQETSGSSISLLSNRYSDRVIIFDSAPLLLPTEASVLASHMGQVVVVVEAEITDSKLVKQSVDMLDNRIVLLVLNKVRQQSDFGSYGHYGHDQA